MAENISSIDNFSPASPIGIFDSGIGGLTVAKAVVEKLPQESIIYFGDTLHLPYGDKSKETITTYVLRIVDLLLLQKCKLILIACGSASAAAYEEVKKHVGSKALVLNVIDPMIDFLDKNYRNKRVGLIATKQTVESRVYNDKIKLLNGANIDFTSMATPLLVPIIEEGFAEHEIVDLVLKEYFSAPELQGINALVLGCTHYSVIEKAIARCCGPNVKIIEYLDIVASKVKEILDSRGLLNKSGNAVDRRFYVSEYTKAFAEKAKMFFGADVNLQLFS